MSVPILTDSIKVDSPIVSVKDSIQTDSSTTELIATISDTLETNPIEIIVKISDPIVTNSSTDWWAVGATIFSTILTVSVAAALAYWQLKKQFQGQIDLQQGVLRDQVRLSVFDRFEDRTNSCKSSLRAFVEHLEKVHVHFRTQYSRNAPHINAVSLHRVASRDFDRVESLLSEYNWLLGEQTDLLKSLRNGWRRMVDSGNAYLRIVRRYSCNEGKDLENADERYQAYLREGPVESNRIFIEMKQAFEEYLDAYFYFSEQLDGLGSFLHKTLFGAMDFTD